MTDVDTREYWRARCPVEAEDIELSGVTWEHVEAWIIAQPDGGGLMCTDGRPFEAWRLTDGLDSTGTISPCIWVWACGLRIHRGRTILASVLTAAKTTKRGDRDVLDEMAALASASLG